MKTYTFLFNNNNEKSNDAQARRIYTVDLTNFRKKTEPTIKKII